jgi:UDP-glucuronate decarboxylase
MINQIIAEDLEFILDHNFPWHKFNDKTVLISGANGIIPAYMVKTLLHCNQRNGSKLKVLGLIRNKAKASVKFSDYIGRDDLQFIVHDICEPISINQGIDYIIHAASNASPKYFGKDPVGTLSANVLGTYHLLELAREKKVEGFLFFSSGEIYGNVAEHEIPIREDSYGYIDPTDVRSCYGESKRMGENMCISWQYQYGVPVKIVRPFHTYGPGMNMDDGRVFADFVFDIVYNRNIKLKSDGDAVRAFCYLADAVAGFFKVLLEGGSGEAYNVGNDKAEISIRELANRLIRLFPEKKIHVIRDEQLDDIGYLKSKIFRYCPDISKIKLLGWEPRFSLEEGFKRTIRSYS